MSSLEASPEVYSTASVPSTRMSSLDMLDRPFIGTALVIGGSGFLGHHIVRELLNEPTCTSVAVMSRSPFQKRYHGVTYHIGDITIPEHVQHIMSQVKPNVIFNTASPHAYVDHKSVPEIFRCNVDGNKNLLDVAAQIGTVRAYIYTSSGPIIAGSGAGYDHADETYPTLAEMASQKGDPYHIAKAMGDKLVLEANRKHGIRTCTIRPTALYGEGDHQMVEPTIRALEDGVQNIWPGYNDAWMDVVYVGHVSRLQILACKGLLAGLTDPNAPKVDGEAFNITDDEPAHPLDFFRKYWTLAGDNTPMSSVWLIHPAIVMIMAHIAEFFTWAISFGKLRPLDMKIERMEFVLYTRTYSIKKARERLGFVPWHDQPHPNQEAAVKGAVDWYLQPENHGPVRWSKFPSWPETPFKLIAYTGVLEMTNFPKDHYCVKNARIMAQTHNTILRALNAIYHHASLIAPGTEDVVDLLTFCNITCEFMHHHHIGEEMVYFPELEKATGQKALMEVNINQHADMDVGLSRFHKYTETTKKEDYDGITLRKLIDDFKDVYEKHQHEEIQTILSLHDKIDSKTLEVIDVKFRKKAEIQSDIFKSAPLVMGCQDAKFLLDNEKIPFPDAGFAAPYVVDAVLSRRHAGVWRFLPSTMHGQPRRLPTFNDFITSLDTTPSTFLSSFPNLQKFLAVLLTVVIAYSLLA